MQSRGNVMKQVAIALTVLLLTCLVQESRAAGLVWQTSKQAALQLAVQQQKKVLLVVGRDTCQNTKYMRFTILESVFPFPPVKELVEQQYIAWYANMDHSTEWQTYAAGLGAFNLPIICVIDPANSGTYLDRSTDVQSADKLYARLQAFIKSSAPPPVPPANSSQFLTTPSLIKK